MGEFLKRIIDALWPLFVEPVVKLLDQWDALFLALTIAAFAAWWFYWTNYCGLSERVLWGMLFAGAISMWFVARLNTRKRRAQRDPRIMPRNAKPTAGERQRLARRLSLIKSATIPALLGVWFCAALLVYKMPRIPNGLVGIQIGCFENDPGGVYQSKLVQNIRDSITTSGLQHLVAVSAIPRHIGGDDTKRAREIGAEGHAVFVLFGEVTAPERFKAQMVAANAPGVFDSEQSFGKYLGHQSEIDGFYDLPAELETLSREVVIFLGGYARYHVGDYKNSLLYFNRAREELLPITEKQTSTSPEKGLLGTIEFYSGNVHYFLSQQEQSTNGRSQAWRLGIEASRAAYRKAIDLTSHPIEGRPQYIEPLNNFAFVSMIAGDPNSAVGPLENADAICQRRSDSDSPLCLLVGFNLGEARRKTGKYKEAHDTLSLTRDRVENILKHRQDSGDQIFLASLYQAAAFCSVKIAEATAGPPKDELYRQATQELDRAKALLTNTDGRDVPILLSFNQITRARVELGYSRWQQAIDILNQVGTKLEDPDIDLLLSIAFTCTNRNDVADQHFTKFTAARFEARVIDDSKWAEDISYEKKITSQCSGK